MRGDEKGQNRTMLADDLSSISLDQLIAAGNWQQQYKLIIQWGKLVSHKPDIRFPANLIQGCEIPVWLAVEHTNDALYFSIDADSHVIKGLAVLLLVQVNGKSAAELDDIDLARPLHNLGLEKHLTPSRNNGLNAIIARIRKIPGQYRDL